MIRRFLRDERGNYITMTAILLVPLMGSLALAVDYAQISKQRQATLNALDAANIATARRLVEGATDAQAKSYAESFFKANLSGAVDSTDAVISITLPKNNTGGGTLLSCAGLKYKPFFFPAFTKLMGNTTGDPSKLDFRACSEVRLKNTMEVALVLDNSGSMDYLGTGSGQKRIDLLKAAAKQLVDTIAAQAAQMKQVDKPVQFGLVPFAASVNVGNGNASAAWMDKDGISPIHHENFDWSTMSSSYSSTKYAQKVGDVWYARGADWGTQKDQPLTRFALYNLMQHIISKTWVSNWQNVCISYRTNGTCRTWQMQDQGGYSYGYENVASWGGCVESRPYPYNVTDDPATTATPATMFVPMFGPDETDRTDSSYRPANNNWLTDRLGGSDDKARQQYMPKYFETGTDVSGRNYGMDEGPNVSCSTKAITPLTDVSTTPGLNSIKSAIDGMTPGGATNVPEGMAWGWRVVSGGAPFTEGRADSEKGNDKVVIVLTDGANTYYTPSSVIAQDYSGTNYLYGGNDNAGNKAIYSSYGYAGTPYQGGDTRLFKNTSVTKTDYSNSNYTKALNQQFDTLCANAKAKNLIVMTVSLDLDSSNTTEKAQMDALKACSSDSRFRKDPSDLSKPAKLYWNATGSNLADKFKEIADELSNLRIVG